MKTIYTGVLVLCFSLFLNAQVLFEENFDYPVGDSLVQHGWTVHSGSGTALLADTGSLSYPGYDLSGIGNSVLVTGGSGSRMDENITYAEQDSGAVYASFLVNVASSDTLADYFFHLGPEVLGSSYRGRIFIKDDGNGNLHFGLSKSGGSGSVPPVFTTAAYSYNTTYLLVLKYEFIDTLASDDTVRLYINPDINAGEPLNADLVNSDTSSNGLDRAMGCVALRQGARPYEVTVDGIRITTDWSSAVPVELTSFAAIADKNEIKISWRTATETNNYGFELYRNDKMISFIPGAGTTTEARNYSYQDKNLSADVYRYRLLQIDLDGTRETVAQKEVNLNSMPVKFNLSQNYPNPFNPSTKINFSLPADAQVKLSVFNLLGEKVSDVLNGSLSAGEHSINFNAAGLQSGVYFYTISAKEIDGSVYQSSMKMTLMK